MIIAGLVVDYLKKELAAIKINKSLHKIKKNIEGFYGWEMIGIKGCYNLYDYNDLQNKIEAELKRKQFEIISASKVKIFSYYYLVYKKNSKEDMHLILSYRRKKNHLNKYAFDVFELYLKTNGTTNVTGLITKNQSEAYMFPYNKQIKNWKLFIKNVIVDIKNVVKEIYYENDLVFEYSTIRPDYYDHELADMSYTENFFNYYTNSMKSKEFFAPVIFDMYNFYLSGAYEKHGLGFIMQDFYRFSRSVKKLTILIYKNNTYIGVNILTSKKTLLSLPEKNKIKIYYLNSESEHIKYRKRKDSIHFSYYVMLTDNNGYKVLKYSEKFVQNFYETLRNKNSLAYLVIAPIFDSEGKNYHYFIYKNKNFNMFVSRIYIICHTDEGKKIFDNKDYLEIFWFNKDNFRIFSMSKVLFYYGDYKNIIDKRGMERDNFDFLAVWNMWILFFIYIIKKSNNSAIYYVSCEEDDCGDIVGDINQIYSEVLPSSYGRIQLDFREPDFYWLVAVDKISKNGIIILLETDNNQMIKKTIALIGSEENIIKIMNKIEKDKIICVSYTESSQVNYGHLDRYNKNVVSGYDEREHSNNSAIAIVYASVKLC